MRFPAARLVPREGDLYAHLFENPATGLARNVYWSVTVDFETLDHAGEAMTCTSTVDWLRPDVRDWRALGGRTITLPRDDGLAESSFYVGEHLPARTTKLAFRPQLEGRFGITLEQVVDLRSESGEEADAQTSIRADVEVPYRGLIVVPGNLSSIPATPESIGEALRPHIDVAAYHPLERDGRGFILRPRW